jgi:BirA family biotin operon repressor/biotin-[acetyl-CoA-carboxylase] ligase
MSAPDLTPAALERHLHATHFGHRVHYYRTLGSTNDRALELAAAGEPEGAIVLAEEQTRGRGRRARSWRSPPHLGIYASIVLRPGIAAPRAPLLTLLAAVGVTRALQDQAGVPARIKWPNDVIAGGRKIAGVLAEARGSEPVVREVVVGFGVNADQLEEDFPPDVRALATSVRIETGRVADRPALLAAILEECERRYTRLVRGEIDDLRAEWAGLASGPQGGRVVVDGPGGRREGILLGVDVEGGLLLRGADGTDARVPFGEIVHVAWP